MCKNVAWGGMEKNATLMIILTNHTFRISLLYFFFGSVFAKSEKNNAKFLKCIQKFSNIFIAIKIRHSRDIFVVNV